MAEVYILKCDFNHSGDSETDATHMSFKDDKKISLYFSNPLMYGDELLPEKIYFQADFNLIPKYDYPLTDLRIPVMSLRMLRVFEELESFEYSLIPVVMIDDTFLEKVFDDNGLLNNKVTVNEDYVALRLSKWMYFFDYDNSDYKPSSINPNIPGTIKKAVLKKPLSGFPPIFRMDRLSSNLFVSAEAKTALEAANIKGCIFEPVETS